MGMINAPAGMFSGGGANVGGACAETPIANRQNTKTAAKIWPAVFLMDLISKWVDIGILNSCLGLVRSRALSPAMRQKCCFVNRRLLLLTAHTDNPDTLPQNVQILQFTGACRFYRRTGRFSIVT